MGFRFYSSSWLWMGLAGAILLFCCASANAQQSQALPPEQPEIVSRQAWGALPPNAALLQEQKPSEIIIHHTGTLQQPRIRLETKMRGLQSFSMNPGRVGLFSKPAWGDVLYHFYVEGSGKIAEGRDISFAGDAASKFDNEDRIQIVLEGDFEREQPTKEQLASLTKLVTWLALAYSVPPENISGHADHEQTSCPGKNLKPFLAELKKAVWSQYASGAK